MSDINQLNAALEQFINPNFINGLSKLQMKQMYFWFMSELPILNQKIKIMEGLLEQSNFNGSRLKSEDQKERERNTMNYVYGVKNGLLDITRYLDEILRRSEDMCYVEIQEPISLM